MDIDSQIYKCRSIRKILNITLQDVADKMYVTRGTVSNIEVGRYHSAETKKLYVQTMFNIFKDYKCHYIMIELKSLGKFISQEILTL